MSKALIKATKSTPFMVVMGLVIVAAVGFVLVPQLTKAGAPGAIWTTNGDCGDESQDVNQYNVGDAVFINGSNFDEGDYDWNITGKPGGASADPDIQVAWGNQSVGESRSFCFNAYTVQSDDDGEYGVSFGTKNDNYRVDGVRCGNSELEPGEICDQGTANGVECTPAYNDSCTYCSDTCQWVDVQGPYCGNHVKDGAEECDDIDGLPNEHYTCSEECTLVYHTYCGDNIRQGYEECDGIDGDFGPHQSCNVDCQVITEPYCGDDQKNGDEECDNVDGIGPFQTCSDTCELVDQTFNLHGYKWDDLNGNGVRDCQFTASISREINILPPQDCEPLLSGWTVFIDENGNGQLDGGETSMSTDDGDHFGWYWFEGLAAGNYTVCEVPQAGWNQTYPSNDNNNCHGISVPDGEGTCWGDQQFTVAGIQENAVIANATCNFGNQADPKICGDGIVNQETEQCDGTDGVGENQVCTARCILEDVPYCGDGIVNQEAEQCDGTDGITGDQTCTQQCTIVEPEPGVPVLSIVKNVGSATTNPGGTLEYTVTVSNSSDTDATDVVLTDVLPAGLTFADADGNSTGETTMTWPAFNLVAGGDQTFTYTVVVDSNATADTYENVATATAENVEGSVTAKADVEVQIPVVLGETAPALSIKKSTNAPGWTNPGGTLSYTIVVTNTGDAPAMQVMLTDTLPLGFTFAKADGTSSGERTYTWDLGDLVPDESATRTYQVKVDMAMQAGKYPNTASVAADDVNEITATATAEIRAVSVLGAEDEVLPITGSGLLTIIYFAGAGSVLGFSLYSLKLTAKKKS